MKFKNFLIIISVYFIFQSCKNEIDINAPWKETAVVSGFLDIGTTQQYLRITKTFQNSANLTPQQAAQISDSLYFDTLIVFIVDLTTGIDTFNFVKNTSVPKDPGYFANDKNILYYDSMQPKFGHVYQLTIKNPKSGNTYSSQTSIVGLVPIMPGNRPPNIYTLDIFYTPGVPNYIQYDWSAAPNGAIYTALIRYKYTETINNQATQKYTDQYIAVNEQSKFGYTLLSSQMNQFLINIFGLRDVLNNPGDTAVFRKLNEVDYVVLAGTNDLLTAVDLSKPNTSLLQVKPNFSNIQNGLGLFTSRSTSILNVPFDPRTPYSSEKNLMLNVKGFAQP